MVKWLRRFLFFTLFFAFLFAISLGLAFIYKKEILAEVNGVLKTAIQADVQIEDASLTIFEDFPNITLRLHNVRARAIDSTRQGNEFFKTQWLNLNLTTHKLIFKEIHFRSLNIEDGEIFIFRTRRGYSNIDLLKRKKEDRVEQAENFIELTNGKIHFERVHFIHADSAKRQFFSFVVQDALSGLNYSDSVVDGTLAGAIDFDGLQFTRRGQYLHKTPTTVNLKARYYMNNLQLFLEPSNLYLAKSNLQVKGHFDFSGKKNASFSILSEGLDYAEGLTVIPEAISSELGKFTLKQPFRFSIDVEVPLKPGAMAAYDIRFVLRDNVLESKPLRIVNLSLEGDVTNHARLGRRYDNRNSMVRLHNVTGAIDDLPFKANAVMTDFDDLNLELHSTHDLALSQLNAQVDTTVIRFLKGRFTSSFVYRGKLAEYLLQGTEHFRGTLTGESALKDGSLLLVQRKLLFRQINAGIRFTEDTVWIDRSSFSLAKSTLQATGKITNFVPFFARPDSKGYVVLDLRSPSIDLGSVLVKKKTTRTSRRQKQLGKKRVSDALDQVFRNLRFDVTVHIDQLRNRNFAAAKLNGRVSLSGTTLEARDLTMNFAGGKLNLNFTMRNLHRDINPMELTARASNVRIRDLFRSFGNFNQKVITDKNLQGTVSLNASFRTRVNDDFAVLFQTLRGNVTMTIRNGRLTNVEALSKMSNFLFKKRDFDDVKFAQINGRFQVAHRDLNISRMEVQSTVLSLFLEGHYSLDHKTDLTIQVPLSNLKKRDRSYIPKNVGVDAKVGPSVFLRAVTNDQGETEISYDLFRKKKSAGTVAAKKN